MRAIFKDASLQKQFEKDGYVKLRLINEDEVSELLNFYQETEFNNKIPEGFHISLDNMDQDLVESVGEKIRSKLAPKAEEVFDQCKVFTASYVIKEPGKQNIVPPHQDWTFVEEAQFCSCTLWTPLVDVTEENGALGIIPGSHKLFKHHRSSPSPQSKSPLADHIFTLFPYVKIIEMKAGETLVFDNRLIHASPPNLTEEPRIAVGIGLTQEEAQLIHYYHIPGSEPAQLEKYEVDSSFYTWFNNKRLSDIFDSGETPKELLKTETIQREIPDLSKDEMEKLVISLDGVEVNQPLMEKLAALFDYNVDGTKKEEAPQKEEAAIEEKEEWVDDRSFFQKYTPANIYKEIRWRLSGKN